MVRTESDGSDGGGLLGRGEVTSGTGRIGRDVKSGTGLLGGVSETGLLDDVSEGALASCVT